ncbi:hypothetical protein DEJ13_02740 [Curtobacterium sp. MCLR17_007]|uniref:hypothetical protein n=1 Tax=Curtobacterium sp. MCLR17_007 TaxID=2175648 RepID=UPI0011B3AAA9|nr:hypothetical protein [Curtobacterium sp. MCLR17_007]WIB60766.1 hypothetical protein DEJ13_02740 [Curtobacterium sp. MCLR17_007]
MTLVSIPILIGAVGAGSWASLAVAQAVGTAGAIIVGFGWGITGPTAVASATPASRFTVFFDSFWARLTLVIPVAAIAVAVTFLSVQVAVGPAALNSVSYTLTGLLSGWYFTGVARPWSFLVLDAAPRVLGTALGTAFVAFGAPLSAYPMAQLAGVAVGVVVTAWRIGDGRFRRPMGWRSVIRTLGAQSHGMLLSSVSAVVTALPPVLVSLIAPAALPAYTLADKLLRFATTGFSPVLQYFQGWVPGVIGAARVRRSVRAAKFGLVLAGLGGVAFALLAPFAGSLLSQGSVSINLPLSLAFGAVLVLLVAAQVIGLIGLLSLGAARQYARYTVIGAVIGMPLTLVGAAMLGATGAVSGFAIGELVAFVLEIALFVRLTRQQGDGSPTPDLSDPFPT